MSAALLSAGAEAVFVCNRTMERAAALCAWDKLGRMAPAGFDGETLARLAAKSGLLVNCTSLGMTGEFERLDFLTALPAGAAVCDLVYNPPETALLKGARRLGHPAMNGFSMLIYQAVLALEHFLDRELDREAMAKVAWEALEKG